MSLNSLKIATDGYLKRTTKAVLVIAVAGYLNFGGTPPKPPSPSVIINDEGGNKNKGRKEEYLERIVRINDDLMFTIIKIWTEKCQT